MIKNKKVGITIALLVALIGGMNPITVNAKVKNNNIFEIKSSKIINGEEDSIVYMVDVDNMSPIVGEGVKINIYAKDSDGKP